MFKRTSLVVLAAAVFLGSSCPPQQGGSDNPDNALVPRLWEQVYGNKQSTGFNAVHTQFALPVLRKWTAPVGPSFSTFPVIGPDGRIWGITSSGELVGINPDGSPHLRRKLDDTIIASAAINPDTYEIFVVGQRIINTQEAEFESRIYRLTSGVGLLNVSSEPLKTGAAPKLWRNFIFLNAGRSLKVFDQNSLLLVGEVPDTTICFNLVCGSSDITDALGDFFSTFADCIVNLGCGFSVSVGGTLEEPSVAIFDQAAIVGDTNRPIIVVLSPMCASGYRFYPDGDGPGVFPNFNDRHFELLWTYALVDVDCDFDTVRSTSPVALPGSAVVFGDENGRVLELDALTGAVLWERKLNEAIQCPPVSGLRQIYVVERNHLATLDSDGSVISEVPLVGVGRGAALSLDFVYVATTNGLHTFGITPEQGFVFAPVQPANPGAAYVALGEDGTLYVSAHNNNRPPDAALVAYSPTGTIARAIAFPTVTWQTPADGTTTTSAPGKTLMAAVAGPGGAFDGTVTFTSSLDGTLCENVTPTNGTATCTTSQALTIGAHTLTAFANDVSGGTISAAITVQVVDTPPTVAITAPADNAVFGQGAAINFTADVTDPDQASFTPDKIVWQSSIDGAIGTGLSFSRTLSLGTHTITATATDQSGATGSASVTIQVTQGPVVTIQQPTENFTENDITDITFTASVVDSAEPNFPSAGVKWTSNLDGDLGTGLTITRRLSVGNHTITVTATDSHGLSGTATVHVIIFAS